MVYSSKLFLISISKASSSMTSVAKIMFLQVNPNHMIYFQVSSKASTIPTFIVRFNALAQVIIWGKSLKHFINLAFIGSSYTHLCVFSCLCYKHLSSRHKLAPHFTSCIFIGYPREFCYLNLKTKKILHSHHVTFDENISPYASMTPPILLPTTSYTQTKILILSLSTIKTPHFTHYHTLMGFKMNQWWFW